MFARSSYKAKLSNQAFYDDENVLLSMLCNTLASSLTWLPNTWECGWRLPSWTATEEQNYFILFSINLKLKETHVVRNSEELIASWPPVNSWLPTVLRLCYLEKQAGGQIRPRAGFTAPGLTVLMHGDSGLSLGLQPQLSSPSHDSLLYFLLKDHRSKTPLGEGAVVDREGTTHRYVKLDWISLSYI